MLRERKRDREIKIRKQSKLEIENYNSAKGAELISQR